MVRARFALAVHALVLLARSPESATSAFLAGSVNTHATCLRRVMATLTRAGMVSACEGRHGGYHLARPASEITLADIYRAVSGEPLFWPNPAAANPRCPISVAMGPALAEIAADAEARFQEALAGRSLADVADQIEVAVPRSRQAPSPAPGAVRSRPGSRLGDSRRRTEGATAWSFLDLTSD